MKLGVTGFALPELIRLRTYSEVFISIKAADFLKAEVQALVEGTEPFLFTATLN